MLKSSLEEKLGLTLKDDGPILAWLPRHGADLLSRYRKGEDGRTPEQRRSGKAWRRPALEFGERLYYREAGAKGASKSTLQMKMLEGRYIGHHGGTGSLLVITTEGRQKGTWRSTPNSGREVETSGLDGLERLPLECSSPRRWATPVECRRTASTARPDTRSYTTGAAEVVHTESGC